MHNAGSSDWNDIRYVLEVARSGSTLSASRRLKVSQSTVMRRIAMLEQMLALELFEKSRTGYVATEALGQLMPLLLDVEKAHHAFQSRVSAIHRDISGVVTVTAPEILCALHLNRAAAELSRRFPSIRLEIVASERRLDLASGEADIAIRGGLRPTDGELFGRCIAHETWSYYCSRAYAAAHGMPRSPEDFAGHPFLSLQPDNFAGYFTEWLRSNLPPQSVVVRHSGIVPLFYGVKSGLGVSLLNDFIVGDDDDFLLCFTPDNFMRSEVWILTHERHRKTMRVRAVMEFLATHFSEIRSRRQLEAKDLIGEP